MIDSAPLQMPAIPARKLSPMRFVVFVLRHHVAKSPKPVEVRRGFRPRNAERVNPLLAALKTRGPMMSKDLAEIIGIETWRVHRTLQGAIDAGVVRKTKVDGFQVLWSLV